jgi:hypothetical protein
LPGLLSRATTENDYRSMSEIAEWFGIQCGGNHFGRADMRKLAIGAINIEQAARFTEHTTEQIRAAAFSLAPPIPGGLHDEYLSIERWKSCPVCLKEGKSHQRSWMVPFVTACPHHGCELLDHCQVCSKPSAVNLPMVPYCLGCQAGAEARPADPIELDCSTRLLGLMDREEALKVQLDRLMTAWHLSTSEALRPHHRFSPQKRSVAEMRQVVIRIWAAASSAVRLGYAIETQTEDLSKKWPRLSGLPRMLVDRARERGALIPPHDIIDVRIPLLDVNDPWMVPVAVAAQAAGVSDHIMNKLVKQRAVRSRLWTEVDQDNTSHQFRLVDLNHLDKVIDSLFKQAKPAEEGRNLSGILMFPLHEVIRDVRSGRMAVFKTGGPCVSDLMVAFRETRTMKRRSAKPVGTMTSSEVAKQLGTYHAVVADLAAKKILRLHPDSTRTRLLVDEKSAAAFHCRYILVGSLAAQIGHNPTNLADKLAEIGVRPEPIDSLTSVFLRSSLDEVDLDELADLDGYSTAAGRPSTVDPASIKNPAVKMLLTLIAMERTPGKFSRKAGISNGNLSMILHEKKGFGRLAARRMEDRLGLTRGALSDLVPSAR